MNTTTIGLDIAKAVFPVHGIDAHGQTTLRKRLRRVQLVIFFANLPPCLLGLEACASAHPRQFSRWMSAFPRRTSWRRCEQSRAK